MRLSILQLLAASIWMVFAHPPTALKAQQAPHSDMESDQLAEMRRLVESDPAKDFQEAKSRGDIHFVAVNGISLMVPGVGSNYRQYGIEARVVPGTSDAPSSREQLELIKKTIGYAEKYNELVLAFVLKKGK